ncbi:hypothetical protein JCM8547_006384 [Rhodosporidiobolus lusitaniae]
MGVPWTTLVAFLALVYAAWWALPNPPSSSSTASPTSRQGAVFAQPGPVLASRITNLKLDGLTAIPVTRLPRLKARLDVPFTSYSVFIALDLQTSETVLRKLRVRSSIVKARDVLRESIEVGAEDVDVDMQASAGARFEVVLERRNEGIEVKRVWSWKTASSGRVNVALEGASLSAATQVVAAPKGGAGGDEMGMAPRLAFLSASLSPGNCTRLSLSPTFAPCLPSSISIFVFSTLVPSLRNSPPSRFLTSKLVAFLLQELLESRVADDLLSDLSHFIVKHVDGEVYGGMTDDERDEVLSSFFSSSPTPSPLPLPSEPAPSSSSSHLSFSALLHGPTLLTRFPLPQPPSSALPIFASSSGRGLRNRVLSSPILNQVTTGPPAVDLGASEFERIGFAAARVELTPPSSEGEGGKGERDLVLGVTALEAVLTTAFTIRSELRTAPSLLLGDRNLTTPGSTITSVSTSRLPSQPLRIRLPLLFSPGRGGGLEEGWRIEVLGRPSGSFLEGVGGVREGGIRVEGEFDKLSPRVRMESRLLGRMGERVVNAVLEGVEALITPLTAPLCSFFLADLARLRLQRVLDDVCGRVRDEGGVEWTIFPPDSSVEVKEGE